MLYDTVTRGRACGGERRAAPPGGEVSATSSVTRGRDRKRAAAADDGTAAGVDGAEDEPGLCRRTTPTGAGLSRRFAAGVPVRRGVRGDAGPGSATATSSRTGAGRCAPAGATDRGPDIGADSVTEMHPGVLSTAPAAATTAPARARPRTDVTAGTDRRNRR